MLGQGERFEVVVGRPVRPGNGEIGGGIAFSNHVRGTPSRGITIGSPPVIAGKPLENGKPSEKGNERAPQPRFVPNIVNVQL